MKYNRSKSKQLPELDAGTLLVVAERSKMIQNLLTALANAVAANEETERRFRYAVICRLCRMEATVKAIHAVQLCRWEDEWEVEKAKKAQERAQSSEEFISKESMRLGLDVVRYIYQEREEPPVRRRRKSPWSGWEI